jgi:two-component system sensor histidine kinase UhpB
MKLFAFQKQVMKFLLFLLLCTVPMVEFCYGQSGKIDSLQRILARHTRDTNEIRAMGLLADEFQRKDMAKAKSYVYQQIELAKALNTNFGISEAYTRLVSIHQNAGSLDSAQYYLSRLEILAKDNIDKKAAVRFAQAAGLFYKNQGKYKEALPFLLESSQLTTTKVGKAGSLLNVGNAYSNMGEFRKAADYHLKALVAFEEIKNEQGQSFCLNSLGANYMKLRQHAAAEQYIMRSEKLKEQLGDKRGVIHCWINLSQVYQQTQKPELAMSYINKALLRAQELKLSLVETKILFDMGWVLKQYKRAKEAMRFFEQALPLARQAGDSVLVSRIKTYLIATENDQQKEEKEELVLLQNIKISLENKALVYAADGHFQLATWYEDHQRFDKAIEHLKVGHQLNDSIAGGHVAIQLKKLEEDYKTAKREKEITLLKKNRELQALSLSRQRVIIISSLVTLVLVLLIGVILVNRYRVTNQTKRLLEIEKVRNNIARDLHDDIGSTLSSINILSKVAREEKSGNEAGYLQKIGEQSARMMEYMSDMVWSINPNNDSISQMLIRMREFASDILESKNMEYHFSEKVAEELVLNAEQRKNIFLIFKETLNNAAKYSKGSRVEIGIYSQTEWLTLTMEDDGQGFDPKKVTEGNGLRNLRKRAEEISGTLTLISTLDKGTKLRLQVPIA